ncbi:MAG: hypothetical protein R6W78_19195 [Bacteroidales bacterium]
MKKSIFTSILALLITGAGEMRAQEWPKEYLGLPGDNLNLYAVMDLFRESETLEGFEKSLNDEKTLINNLDLNDDNMVDYISVADYQDGNVHTIVLRAMLYRNESQDVAVFTVEQLRNGEVQIQLIGDEALYGRNYIVEPNYAETPNPGYRGATADRRNVTMVTTTYRDIAVWPVVRFIYHPTYVVWRSSWYWGYYPVYWNPWRTYYWHYYYGYHYNWHNHYYTHYRHSNHYRYPHYNTYYYSSVRNYSPRVSVNISKGYYKSTYSRPEMRREGEARYSSVNAGGTSRSRMSDATVGRERTNEARSAQVSGRASGNAVTGRRNANTDANSNISRSSAAQHHATGGRTVTNGARRPEITPSETRATVNTQRSVTTTAQRRTPATEATRGVATANRSANTSVPYATKKTTARQPVSNTAPAAPVSNVSSGRTATRTATVNTRNNVSGSRQVHAPASSAGQNQTINNRSVSRPVSNVSKSTATSRTTSNAITQRSSSRPAATSQKYETSSRSRSSSAATTPVRRSNSR